LLTVCSSRFAVVLAVSAGEANEHRELSFVGLAVA
jgi:hypothetical protein